MPWERWEFSRLTSWSFVKFADSREREERKKTVLAERAGATCPYGFTKGSHEPVAATFEGRVGDR